MSKILKQLEAHSTNRSLVTLRRKKIESGRMQGIILGCSSKITLAQHVYDFHIDGLLFLNTSDITSVKSTGTDKLHCEILGEEGLIPDSTTGDDFPLSGWSDLLHHIVGTNPILILEDENAKDPILLIGRIAGFTPSAVQVHYFTGAANWEDEPRSIDFTSITCCQLFTNYINKYQSYFDRHPDRDRSE